MDLPVFPVTTTAPTPSPPDASIWYLLLDKVQEETWTHYRTCLTAAELKKAARFVFEKDRRAYIAAHALIRTALSHFVSVDPTTWQYKTNRYGKPEVDKPLSGRQLRFNLSHTKGLVACAVSRSHSVGIDVEAVDRRGMDLKVADSFFAAREVEQLQALPPASRQDAFFNFWTLKESYIKGVGMGLSLKLDSFAFDLKTGQLLTVSEGHPRDWQFKRMKPTLRHRLAVAVQRDHRNPLHVVCAEVSPASLSPIDTKLLD